MLRPGLIEFPGLSMIVDREFALGARSHQIGHPRCLKWIQFVCDLIFEEHLPYIVAFFRMRFYKLKMCLALCCIV